MNSSAHEPPEDRAAVRQALERHQRRREQGVPTLSVLVGVQAEATAAWADWTAAIGWTPVCLEPLAPDAWWMTSEGTAPAERLPGVAVLYLCGSASGGKGPLDLVATVERLSRALDTPGTVPSEGIVALAVGAAEAEAYLHGEERYSRARALFAEGVILLPSAEETPTPTVPAGGGGIEAVPVAGRQPGPGVAISPLAGRDLRPETAVSYDAAVTALRAAESPAAAQPEAADRARSAAERFLFDLLNELPETAGLFELNGRLEFCFGPMPAEVDLLARGLRLALEIDGFHHFREPEGYRRDRRKDALLQRQGYLVLRCLAEDVVVRLEEILQEIRMMVAFRRATGGA